jgi:hypothetical protein
MKKNSDDALDMVNRVAFAAMDDIRVACELFAALPMAVTAEDAEQRLMIYDCLRRTRQAIIAVAREANARSDSRARASSIMLAYQATTRH